MGTSDKRIITIMAVATYLAAKGLAETLDWLLKRDGRPAPWQPVVVYAAFIVFAACGVAAQWPSVAAQLANFTPATDTRLVLAGWIRGNLPPDAVIAQDKYALMSSAPDNPDPRAMTLEESQTVLPQTVMWTSSGGLAADLATLDELRRKGVTHVLVIPYRYENIVKRRLKPLGEYREIFERRAAFYRQLQSEGRLLWHADRPKVHTELQESMALYAI